MAYSSLLPLICFALRVSAAFTPRGETPSERLGTLSNNSAEAWPAPDANGGQAWSSAFARARALVAQMTLEEKTFLITGEVGRCEGDTGAVERLGVPSLCLEDGPAGVRPVLGISQFPSAQAVAATWDRDLMYQRGLAMGQEFYDQGVNVALAPVTGGPLGRSPYDGRLWEGFAADPYGTGVASYMTVKGMLDAGIMTTAKHWIGYEQETFRDLWRNASSNSQLPISSNIDDTATHELYMWGFAEAIRAGTGYVMCSYNEVNQTHSCADAYSLNGLLKGELNFQGAVISDWGATWGNAPFINGGLDIDTPGNGDNGTYEGWWGDALIDLVNNGSVAEARIDDAATRVLTPWIASGQADKPLPEVTFNYEPAYNFSVTVRDVRKPETADLIRQIGEDSAVLLKNVDGALPLKRPKAIAMIGNDAAPNLLSALQATSENRFPDYNLNGTLTLGGGSGWAIYPYMVTPYEAINYRARKLNSMVFTVFNDSALDAVAQTVPVADVALVFVSQYRMEGADPTDLLLDRDGELLIQTVAANNNNTIVVMHTGGPVFVEDWFDHENVTAVINAPFPGQEAGDAIAAVLFGDVSPSGKMPFTTARSLSDYEQGTITRDNVTAPQSYFNESTLIDYRWFNAMNITPRFSFGFGMSYSTFEFANIEVKDVSIADNTSVQRTNEAFQGATGSESLYDTIAQVTVEVTNTGNVTACEVAQLYATLPGSQAIWLRGFDKLQAMMPGEKRTATFDLRRKDLSLWSPEDQNWFIPDGDVILQVGSSSTDLHLDATWSSSS